MVFKMNLQFIFFKQYEIKFCGKYEELNQMWLLDIDMYLLQLVIFFCDRYILLGINY